MVQTRINLGAQLKEARLKNKAYKPAIFNAGLRYEQIQNIESGANNYTVDVLIKYLNAAGLQLIAIRDDAAGY